MRERIFLTIEPTAEDSRANTLYSAAMMVIIVISLLPLAFKQTNAVFTAIEWACAVIFVGDYILRLWTADFKLHKGKLSFLLFPFTPMAVIDLLALLPVFVSVSGGLKVLKVFRLLRTFRVLRAFKVIRYSKNIIIICNVIRRQRTALYAVATLAIGYILVSALVIFNIEPDTFGSFFDAIYWATVSLTTVGYGDIFPTSDVGQLVAMISSFIGIAIVALPAGIITAGYMEEISEKKE